MLLYKRPLPTRKKQSHRVSRLNSWRLGLALYSSQEQPTATRRPLLGITLGATSVIILGWVAWLNDIHQLVLRHLKWTVLLYLKPPGESKWHNSHRLGQVLLLNYFQLLGVVAPTVNPPVASPDRTKAGRRYLDHLWVHDLQAPVLALKLGGEGCICWEFTFPIISKVNQHKKSLGCHETTNLPHEMCA